MSGRNPKALTQLAKKAGGVEKIGEVKTGPSFKPGSVCAFLRQEGQEAFVITLTCDGGEYGFEDINSPDTASWDKLPALK